MKIIILVLILAIAGFCYAFPEKVKAAKNVLVKYLRKMEINRTLIQRGFGKK